MNETLNTKTFDLTKSELAHLIHDRAKSLNKDLSSIYRANVFSVVNEAVSLYERDRDPNIINDQIENLILSGRRVKDSDEKLFTNPSSMCVSFFKKAI